MQVHWNPQHGKLHQLKQHECSQLDVQLMSPCRSAGGGTKSVLNVTIDNYNKNQNYQEKG